MPEALLIIDYQNDFIPGGALAVTGGDEIADRINALAGDPRFDLVVATRDWHPANHNSFAEQGGPWPAHCVQGTGGADFSPALEADRVDAVVDAGQKPELEGYSGFEETNLRDLLHERGIDKVTVVGLATDYCVKHTALDALREGFQVEIDSSAVRGVEVEPGDSDRALEEMRAAGANVT